MTLDGIINDDLIKLRTAFQRHGFDVRLVGGAVRDLMRGVTPKDIDLCTDANPDEQVMIYRAERFGYHETGLQHGTITVVINKVPYEITSLRTETDHDGRHATVSYTRDWLIDLGRRDLTFNAMAMTFDGDLIDPFNGLDDLNAGRVRFVGNPDDRMREDYLRILRWLRFHGRMAADQALDPETVEAAMRQAHGLAGISRERVWMEVAKIISGPGGANLIDSMYDLEIASQIDLPMGEVGRVRFAKSRTSNPVTLMVALLHTQDIDDVTVMPDMAKLWKWSAEERDLANFLVSQGAMHRVDLNYQDMVRWMKRLIAHDGKPLDWVLELALMRGETAAASCLEAWSVPKFPVTGTDLLARGLAVPGPGMGALLKRLKAAWADSDYTLSQAALLAQVQPA